MTELVEATTRKAVLKLLLREGETSAAELASTLGISVQAMRRHLRGLKTKGLVKSFTNSRGPGRPLNVWHLTMQGQKTFHDGSENFALELLTSMQSNLPNNAFEEIFITQAFEKANLYRQQIGNGSLEERLKKLVDIRSDEGYCAEFKKEKGSESWYVKEFHCSINKIAKNFPIVCDQELEIIKLTFPDCLVERIQWRFESGYSCGFLITPK